MRAGFCSGRTSALIRRDPRELLIFLPPPPAPRLCLCLPPCHLQWKGCYLQTKKNVLARTLQGWYPDPGLSATRTMKIYIHCLSHQACGMLLWQPQLINGLREDENLGSSISILPLRPCYFPWLKIIQHTHTPHPDVQPLDHDHSSNIVCDPTDT